MQHRSAAQPDANFQSPQSPQDSKRSMDPRFSLTQNSKSHSNQPLLPARLPIGFRPEQPHLTQNSNRSISGSFISRCIDLFFRLHGARGYIVDFTALICNPPSRRVTTEAQLDAPRGAVTPADPTPSPSQENWAAAKDRLFGPTSPRSQALK